MSRKTIRKDKLVIMDGSMAGMLLRYGLHDEERALWESPDTVLEIYREYIQAGADAISTFTMNANRIGLRPLGLEEKAYETALLGTQLARKASEGRVLVGGNVGQLKVKYLRKGSIIALYKEQIRGLWEGGADFIHIRSFTRSSMVKDVLLAIDKLGCDLPVMVTMHVQEPEEVRRMEQFFAAIPDRPYMALGICGCCGRGGTDICRKMKSLTDKPIAFCRDIEKDERTALQHDRGQVLAVTMRPSIYEGLVDYVGGNIGGSPEGICGLKTVSSE